MEKIPEAEIISVADIIPERAAAVAEKTGAKAYSSMEELLNGEKPDVIHLCTPHYLHVPMAVDALNRGIHVLTEKPCAMTWKQLTVLQNAQRRSNAQLGVCFQNRYNRSTEYLLEVIQSGEHGSLTGIRAVITWCRDADYYSSGDWRGTQSQEGGGVLINQAIHTLDLMDLLGGGISAVTAHTSNDHLQGVIEVEDTVSVLAEFRSGIRGVFYATNANAVTSPVMLELNFTKKTLRLEGDCVYEIGDGSIAPVLDSHSGETVGKTCWGNSHGLLICDFYDCIKNGRRFKLDAFEGGRAVELVSRIYESAASGKRLGIG
nr:oxidoreductase family, NAD-binding Rossmann fold protein [uncultured bacterium]